MDMANRIRDRLKERGLTLREVSRRIPGVTQPALSALLNGHTRSMKLGTAVELARELGCSLNWLATGEETDPVVDVNAPASEFVRIKEYSNIEASAGPGCFNEEYPEERTVAYRRSFFRALGVNPRNVKRFRVSGESMEPLIRDGDYVLVDCQTVERILENKIYAFGFDGLLRVKRLQMSMTGGLIIKSDNPDFETEVLTREEAAQSINIIGRVIERTGLVH